jgi:ABC-2 type transport system permease protein
MSDAELERLRRQIANLETHLTTVILDESRSYDSRELVAKMEATEYFRMVGGVDSLGELRHAVDAAQASVGLVIDRDYGKDRHRGAPARALLIVNASDSTTANQAMAIANGISSGLSIQTLGRRAGWDGGRLPIDLRVRPWYNPELDALGEARRDRDPRKRR